ncbi:MAG: hypothetical protein IE918_02180 [Campylobacterales bacterium]|nr:hypothetical protein [Campylobacterales bacterium]
MHLTNGVLLLLFLAAVVLFFWGSFMALKTQQKRYLLAMVPIGLLIVGMFLV